MKYMQFFHFLETCVQKQGGKGVRRKEYPVKTVNKRDLEEALEKLVDEAEKVDVDLKDLFITGPKGDRDGLISESKFRSNMRVERIKLKDHEIKCLIDQY